MELAGRVALITGGKRIGAVVAAELASRGVDVALSYNRSQAEAEKTAASIRGLGRRALVKQANLANAADCEALVSAAADELGRLDILINMASMYIRKPLENLTVEDWDANLAVDLRSAFLCSRAAAPHMRRVGGGRIINFSDWLSRSGRPVRAR